MHTKRINERWIFLFITAGLIFGYACRRTTWEYPLFILTETPVSYLYYWLGKMFAALAVFIFVSLSLSRNKWTKVFSMILSLLTVGLFSAVWGINILEVFQEIIVGLYFVLCYGIVTCLEHFFGTWTSSFLYFILHLLMIAFCSWSFLYDTLLCDIPTVLWMTTCFIMVYSKVYREFTFRGNKRKKFIASGSLVLIISTVLSSGRIGDIIMSLSSSNSGEYAKANWVLYRIRVLTAFFTQEYHLDPAAMSRTQSLTIPWIGITTGRIAQYLYILTVVLFVILLMKMYSQYSGDALMQILVAGIILSNILGILYEINVFYSVKLGTLFLRNPFQLIPIVCLLWKPRKNGIPVPGTTEKA